MWFVGLFICFREWLAPVTNSSKIFQKHSCQLHSTTRVVGDTAFEDAEEHLHEEVHTPRHILVIDGEKDGGKLCVAPEPKPRGLRGLERTLYDAQEGDKRVSDLNAEIEC